MRSTPIDLMTRDELAMLMNGMNSSHPLANACRRRWHQLGGNMKPQLDPTNRHELRQGAKAGNLRHANEHIKAWQPRPARPVVLIKDGKEYPFPSIAVAAKRLGLNPDSLYPSVSRGEIHKGYEVRYA